MTASIIASRARTAAALAAPLALVALTATAGHAATVNGTAGADTLYGTDHSDVIHGYDGNDTIYGKGCVTACGYSGVRDSLYGENGADHVYAGRGVALVKGGYGNDVLSKSGDGYGDVYGGPGNDLIYIYSKGVYVECNGGTDTLYIYNGVTVGGRVGCEHVVRR